MNRNIEILEYLPDVIRGVKELKEIAQTENPEIVSLWCALEDVLNDQFVMDATESGAKRWEGILEIYPKGTDNLDERKFRILTRLNEQLPYTIRMLIQQLETLCGKDGFSAEVKNKEYVLKVRLALVAKSNFTDVGDLLGRIAPANLAIDLDLLYNRHETLGKFTHAQLKRYRHRELRDEVIK